MAKHDFQYGGWNSYALQCGSIMTLISPGGSTCNVTCGSGIMTVNSPSGSRPTLQSDTWLWDDMSSNSPGGITLQCACRSGIMTLNSLSGSTLQCDTWRLDYHPAMRQVALR